MRRVVGDVSVTAVDGEKKLRIKTQTRFGSMVHVVLEVFAENLVALQLWL